MLFWVTILSINIAPLSLAQASGTNISGIINVDTTWTQANSPYTLTGNLLVNNDITLVIQPGTVVNLGSYYIKVNGTLAAKGTADNPIRFNSGSITFTSACKPWDELSQLGCTIQYAILDSTAISTSNAVRLSNDDVTASLSVDSSTTILNSNILGSISGGSVSGSTITGDVNAQTITHNVIAGSVSGNLVANNTITGTVNAMGNVVIANNTVSSPVPSNNSNPSPSGIAINVPSGFFQSGGTPIIENNTITNSAIGISIGVFVRDWVGTNIPVVQNNVIYKNGVGIAYSISLQEQYYGPPTIIQNNTIKQNQVGIQFGDSYQCRFIYNNIEANTNYSLALHYGNNVNASYNWWGTTDSQVINQTIYDFKNDFELGIVDFLPLLSSPNTQAPTFIATQPTPTPTTTPTNTPTQSATPTPTSPTVNPTSNPTTDPTQQPTATPTAPEIPSMTIITLLFIAVSTLAVTAKSKRHVQRDAPPFS